MTSGDHLRTVDSMNIPSISILITLGLVATACASGSSSGIGSAVTETTTTTVAAAPSTLPITTLPQPSTTLSVPSTEPTADTSDDTTADADIVADQLAWLAEAFGADSEPTVAELEAHFTPSFLQQVPPAAFVGAAADLLSAATSPFEVTELNSDGVDRFAASAVIESANRLRFEIDISLDPTEPHLIQGLLLRPVVALPEVEDFDQLVTDLEGIAADAAIGMYDVTDGTCAPVHELRADDVMALGSAFKLWILAELAHQVAAGDAAWDETIEIVDAHRSSPDGEVFGLPTGTEVTLQRLAELMISISDNTATDHLMARLGRRNVEAAMVRSGVADPGRNIPLMSTGAFFQLKFISAAPNADDYRALDAAGRSDLLDQIESSVLPWAAGVDAVGTTNADGVDIDAPRDLDIEFFATPSDICRTHVHLAELAATPGLEPVADILEINPGAGLPFDTNRWPAIRYKGGSEPGVLAVTWWLERNDGRRFVIAGGLSDPTAAFDDTAGVVALASALQLIS